LINECCKLGRTSNDHRDNNGDNNYNPFISNQAVINMVQNENNHKDDDNVENIHNIKNNTLKKK